MGTKALLRRMLSTPRRLGRRRGFGIHSPFGYGFVRNVLVQPHHYYAYESIASGRGRSHCRLLFRLILFFRPAALKIHGEIGGDQQNAIALAMEHCGNAPKCDRIAILGRNASVEAIDHAVGGKMSVVFTDVKTQRSLMHRLWQLTDRGMLFAGGRTAVYVADNRLPHQRFDIWL